MNRKDALVLLKMHDHIRNVGVCDTSTSTGLTDVAPLCLVATCIRDGVIANTWQNREMAFSVAASKGFGITVKEATDLLFPKDTVFPGTRVSGKTYAKAIKKLLHSYGFTITDLRKKAA